MYREYEYKRTIRVQHPLNIVYYTRVVRIKQVLNDYFIRYKDEIATSMPCAPDAVSESTWIDDRCYQNFEDAKKRTLQLLTEFQERTINELESKVDMTCVSVF